MLTQIAPDRGRRGREKGLTQIALDRNRTVGGGISVEDETHSESDWKSTGRDICIHLRTDNIVMLILCKLVCLLGLNLTFTQNRDPI